MKTFIFVLLIACVFAVPQPQNDVGNANEERVKRQLPGCDNLLKNENELRADLNADEKKEFDDSINACKSAISFISSSPIYKMDYLLGVPLVIGVYLLVV